MDLTEYVPLRRFYSQCLMCPAVSRVSRFLNEMIHDSRSWPSVARAVVLWACSVLATMSSCCVTMVS